MPTRVRDGSASPNVLIIGAGIAGLCAGVHAKKCGLDVEIVEASDASGGLATSWKRGDYTFETCLHWLLGSRPGSAFHALWQEVFDIDALTFIDKDEVLRVEAADGQNIVLFRDVHRMEQELLRKAPEDRRVIERFVHGVRRLATCELPAAYNTKLQLAGQLLRMLPYLPELRRWTGLTYAEFAAQCQNPLLRRLLSGGATSEMSIVTLVFSLAWASVGDAGYPLGGSQAVIRAIEQRFRSLGGRIRFNAKVDGILVHGDRVRGAHLTDGEEIHADWVISAADGHATVFDWVPAAYRDRDATAPYERLKAFPSYLQVSLGVTRDLREMPPLYTQMLDLPLTIDPGSTVDEMQFRVFNFDPTFAPRGKTAVTCFIPTFNYGYWVTLQQTDSARYGAAKHALADAVIDTLARRIPGIRAEIEVIDVSTPASVIRHTGNWKGSMEGFLMTPGAGLRGLRKTLPRLQHFLMAGQWVMPGGGLPSGLMTGRDAIRILCEAERRAFTPG